MPGRIVYRQNRAIYPHGRRRYNQRTGAYWQRIAATLVRKYGVKGLKYAQSYWAASNKKKTVKKTYQKGRSKYHQGYKGHGLGPSSKVAKPYFGSRYSAKGRLGTSNIMKRSKGLSVKFPQRVTVDYYYCQSKALVQTGPTAGTIKKIEPLITLPPTDTDHQACILHNLTYTPWNREYKIGNQLMQAPNNQASGYPIYFTNAGNSNISNGLFDYDSPVTPIMCIKNMPRSADISSKPYQIPTHIFEQAHINFTIQNMSAQATRFSIKIVKYNGDTLPFNPKMEDFSSGANLLFPITQKMLNHWKFTDTNEFTTLWSTSKVLKGLQPNRKQTTHFINKTIDFSYKRSTVHKHQMATDMDKLGSLARPSFKETGESWNNVFMVISTQIMDDVVVKFQTSAKNSASGIAGEWTSTDTPIVTDVSTQNNRVFLKGKVTTTFRVPSIYSRVEQETNNLESRVKTLEDTSIPSLPIQHSDISGTYTEPSDPTNHIVVIASTSGEHDYTCTFDGDNWKIKDDGNTLHVTNDLTNNQIQWHINASGNIVTDTYEVFVKQ